MRRKLQRHSVGRNPVQIHLSLVIDASLLIRAPLCDNMQRSRIWALPESTFFIYILELRAVRFFLLTCLKLAKGKDVLILAHGVGGVLYCNTPFKQIPVENFRGI